MTARGTAPRPVMVRRPAGSRNRDGWIRPGRDLFPSAAKSGRRQLRRHDLSGWRPENILPARAARCGVPGLMGGALGDRQGRPPPETRSPSGKSLPMTAGTRVPPLTAHVNGGRTHVNIGQDPDGPGLCTQVRTCNDDERVALVIGLGGMLLGHDRTVRLTNRTRHTGPQPTRARQAPRPHAEGGRS